MNPRGLQEGPKTAQEGFWRGPRRRPEGSGSLPCEGLLELMAKWPPADALAAPRALGPAECAARGEDPRRGCQGPEERT